MSSSLLLLGFVCLIAAIVGGNVRLPGGISFPSLASVGLRCLLALTGMASIVAAMIANENTGVLERPTPPSPPIDRPINPGRTDRPSTNNMEQLPSISRADYINQARALCERRIAVIWEHSQRMTGSPSPEDAFRRMRAFIDAQRAFANEFARLPMPRVEESQLLQIQQSLNTVPYIWSQLAEAAQYNRSRVDSLAAQAEEATRRYDEQVAGYGLPSCRLTR
jgi:hypothetical protein